MNFKLKKIISLSAVLFFICLTVFFPLARVDALEGTKVTGSFSNPLTSTSFESLIEDIIDWVANIGIIIAVGMIIYSGLLFMIAGGRDEKITEARKALTWSLVGLAVLLIGKNWVTLVRSILGG